MTETRKLALDWLRSCQAQTPSVEEVEELIYKIRREDGVPALTTIVGNVMIRAWKL